MNGLLNGHQRVRFAAALLAPFAIILGIAEPAQATTYSVSNTPQLLAAITAANANPGQDTIILAPGIYPITTDAETVDIDDDLIMYGAGPGPSILKGSGPGSFIDLVSVERSIVVDLHDFTIASSPGSGIDNLGVLSLTRMTIAGNYIGIDNRADAVSPRIDLANVTISDNTGFGIEQERGAGPIVLKNVTVAGNDVGLDAPFSSLVSLTNTIFAKNPNGNCDAGRPASSDHSFDDDGSCALSGPGNQTLVDPKLGPLADNGGRTQTRELLSGSPAIDAGTPVGAPPTDQRGVARVGAPDAGAYEFDPSHDEGATATVAAGGTVTTDPEGDGATAADPLETSVTTPTGGSISIHERFASTGGFTLLGWRSQISAPPATAGSPLKIVFRIDASIVPAGANQNTIQVFKNGTAVGECPGSLVASPDPCISERLLLADNDVQLTVLTSTASDWTFGVTAPPSLSISDAMVDEGDAGTMPADFVVTLSSASTQTVTVRYATHDGTATAPADYVAASAFLTFSPGQKSKTISIAVNGDTVEEPDKTFTVDLTSPVNATIADGQGVGTIVDDDMPVSTFDIRIEGEGSIDTPRENKFKLKAGFKKNAPQGHVNFFDKTAKLHFKAKTITGLTCEGDHATLAGTGEVKGSPVSFTIDVTDGGRKGMNDTFMIRLSSPSYSASGPLRKGDIKIKGC